LLEAGRLVEANVLFDKVVAHLPPTADQFVRAAMLVNRAILAWRLSRIPLALELAAEGWTDLGSLSAEGPSAAQTLGRLGYLLEGMGNRRGALETMRASVRLAREAGDPFILSGVLQGLGGVLNFRAVELPEEQARPVFEEARMVLAEGLQLMSRARVHRALLGAYGRSLAGLGELAAAAEAAGKCCAWAPRRRTDGPWRSASGCSPPPAGPVANWSRPARRPRARSRTQSRSAKRPWSAVLPGSRGHLRRTRRRGRRGGGVAPQCGGGQEGGRHPARGPRPGHGTASAGRGRATAGHGRAGGGGRDPLTGLANRLGLERTAPAMLARAVEDGRTAWLVLVDVDWFKSVNDDAGHAAGTRPCARSPSCCGASAAVTTWSPGGPVTSSCPARRRQR